MNSNGDFIVVLCACGSKEQAKPIALALVEERLAACVNIAGPVASVYRWNGEVQHDEEYLLIIKTGVERFDSVAALIREKHSYDTPEIIALPLISGDSRYLAWLSASM